MRDCRSSRSRRWAYMPPDVTAMTLDPPVRRRRWSSPDDQREWADDHRGERRFDPVAGLATVRKDRAGVVDKDVEATLRRCDTLDRVGDRGERRHIRDHDGESVDAVCGDERGAELRRAAILAPPDEDDPRPKRGDRFGRGTSEARRRSGDEDRFPGERIGPRVRPIVEPTSHGVARSAKRSRPRSVRGRRRSSARGPMSIPQSMTHEPWRHP